MYGNAMYHNDIVVYVVGFMLGLLIFLLIVRELACWYWKINRNVQLLTEIRDLLKAASIKESKQEIRP